MIILKFPMICDLLIDQDRYIGGDPVGFKCINEAKWIYEKGQILICDRCRELIVKEPERITYPQTSIPVKIRKAYFEKNFKKLVEEG